MFKAHKLEENIFAYENKWHELLVNLSAQLKKVNVY